MPRNYIIVEGLRENLAGAKFFRSTIEYKDSLNKAIFAATDEKKTKIDI